MNVQRMLSEVNGVDEKGQPTIIKNPKLKITARPFSNYPNRYETELAAIANVYEIKDPTGGTSHPPERDIRDSGNEVSPGWGRWGLDEAEPDYAADSSGHGPAAGRSGSPAGRTAEATERRFKVSIVE